MTEYIERDAALDIIEEMQRALCPVGRFGRCYVCGSDREAYDAWQGVLDSMSAIHAADVAPVVHGRWLYTDGYGLHHMLIVQCSVCGRASEGSLNDRYCPNCGAKMDKEES